MMNNAQKLLIVMLLFTFGLGLIFGFMVGADAGYAQAHAISKFPNCTEMYPGNFNAWNNNSTWCIYNGSIYSPTTFVHYVANHPNVIT